MTYILHSFDKSKKRGKSHNENREDQAKLVENLVCYLSNKDSVKLVFRAAFYIMKQLKLVLSFLKKKDYLSHRES